MNPLPGMHSFADLRSCADASFHDPLTTGHRGGQELGAEHHARFTRS